MDNNRFDALTRGFGVQRNRRDALKGLAAGLLGIGFARGASAQISAERATCGQPCTSSTDCNSGLQCSRPSDRDGICILIADSRTSCNRNSNCDREYELCRDGRCVNQGVCARCNVSADCPTGQICNSGECGGCTRDGQCPNNEICRGGRCERDRNGCRNDSDCRKQERCRNGQCKRRK